MGVIGVVTSTGGVEDRLVTGVAVGTGVLVVVVVVGGTTI